MDGFIPFLSGYWPSTEMQEWAILLYVQSLRSSMFTGFLTLSGFLLTATTFVVIQMKKEVYDQPYYLERWRDQNEGDEGEPVYRPLRNMSRLLVAAIGCSLAASISHITIGLVSAFWSVLFCYAISIVVLVLVGFVLLQISRNLEMWFKDMENEAAKRIAALQEESDQTPDLDHQS